MNTPQTSNIQVLPSSIQVVPTRYDGHETVALPDGPEDDCSWSVYARFAGKEVKWKADYSQRDHAFAFGNFLAKVHGVAVEEYPWMTDADRAAMY